MKDGDATLEDQREMAEESLRSYDCLDDFLEGAPSNLMFYFFHRRPAFMAQRVMTKWNRENLDDYILISASRGFLSRQDCFFVSHFWHSQEHPDPNGEYLRLHQIELMNQEWSYIWVDWTCIPQTPRSPLEEGYFYRSLDTVSHLIRECGFSYFYPPFAPRMWILYEVAEYLLTSSKSQFHTSDIQTFVEHVEEMVRDGVRTVFDKYDYGCAQSYDRQFLTSWLEVLVLLTRLQRKSRFDEDDVRRMMNNITWFSKTRIIFLRNRTGAPLIFERFNGIMSINGVRMVFTPFPDRTRYVS